MEGKGQALDLHFSPRALSSRGRRTPQTIKNVTSQGKAAGLLLVREVFTLASCCWSLFRAIIRRSEQSIHPRQLRLPLAQTSLECPCMSRGAQKKHQRTHPHTCTRTHSDTYIQAHAQEHPFTPGYIGSHNTGTYTCTVCNTGKCTNMLCASFYMHKKIILFNFNSLLIFYLY